jgi:hypothetical protein
MAQMSSGTPNLPHSNLTKADAIFTTVAIISQPVYNPKVKGSSQRLEVCIFNSLRDIRANVITNPKIKITDSSMNKNEKRTIHAILSSDDTLNKTLISSIAF